MEFQNKDFIKKYINWEKLSKEILSQDFIIQYASELDWFAVAQTQGLNIKILNAFRNTFVFSQAPDKNYKDYKEKVWKALSLFQDFDDDELFHFQNELDWNIVCQFQSLPLEYIRKFEDKVNWKKISMYQNLSDSFIEEYNEKLYWVGLIKKRAFSRSFINDCIQRKLYRGMDLKRFKYYCSKYQKCLRTIVLESHPTENCPICFEDKVDCKMPCGHFIHSKKECHQWVDMHNNCPICRKSFRHII